MEKLKMHSPNLTQDNIARIRDLFPGCVTEAKGEDGSVKLAVDFDQLRQELAESIVEGPQERYHLNWPGKREALLAANAPIAKTLRPCREESVDFDTTKNLFIEGDNLDALKLLQENYLGKVKMIYIDPPYNTGNDFIYEDDFAESTEEFLKKSNQKDDQGNRLVSNAETNGRFHSDWLSMIYPRLKLARNLLRDDGVIFISIDDNEIANLKRVCDEIYGEHNFVGVISVENNPKGRKNSAFVSVSSEYCMIYAKSKNDTFFVENIPKKSTDMTIDEDGNFVHGSGKRVLVGENSFNSSVSKIESEKNYSVYYRSSDRSLVIKKEEFGVVDSQLIDEGYAKYFSHYGGHLVENTYSEIKFRELFQERALEFSTDKIYEKNFSDTIRIKSQLTNREYEAIVKGVKQKYSMELTTTGAGTYIKKLFNVADAPFSSPKNIGFIKILVSLFKSDEFIVLDFFSGSSTTADAVMRLNAEDGGNRKFIMVQLPESLDENLERAGSVQEKQTIKSAISICDSINKPHLLTEISKERIRLAGKNISTDLVSGKVDSGFRVLKVDTSNMADVYYAPDALDKAKFDLFVDNIKPDRTPEDLLFQVMLDWGVDLALPIEKKAIQGKDVFFVDGNVLAACFDASGTIDEAFVKELAKHQPLRVVFRDAGYKNSAVKINVEQIFKLLSPATEVKCI